MFQTLLELIFLFPIKRGGGEPPQLGNIVRMMNEYENYIDLTWLVSTYGLCIPELGGRGLCPMLQPPEVEGEGYPSLATA